MVDQKFLDGLTGHRDQITSVKFRLNSYELCSVSSDRSLKLWEINQRGFMETLFGHKHIVNELDILGENNMVSVGEDKRAIVTKVQEETILRFNEREYSLDCVKGINSTAFITGCQDGSVALWSTMKTRPMKTLENSHNNGWVCSLGSVWNSDFVVSGSHDGHVHFYHVDAPNRNIIKGFSLEILGVISSISFTRDGRYMSIVAGREPRLGRWINAKCKDRI